MNRAKMAVRVWRLHGDNKCSYYSSSFRASFSEDKMVVNIDIDYSVFIENLEVVKFHHLAGHADNSTTATH